MVIEKRSILTSILLTFVTCGLYGVYWFCCVTNDAAKASGDDSISGGKAFFLGIITCGIYYFVWAYKMGKMIQTAKVKNGLAADDHSILYIVLQFFGLNLVVCALAQNELNEISDRMGPGMEVPSAQSMGNTYGQQPMGNPYGQQPMGNPYEQQPMGNPYGQQPMGNPYGQQQMGNPYGQPMGNPYGQQPMGNPYGQQPMGNPYGQQPMGNPYEQQPMGNPYGQQPMGNPFEQQMGNPYGQQPMGQPMEQSGQQNGSQPGNM